MRFTTILAVAAFTGFSAAQNSKGPGEGCAGQNVLLACLSTQASRIATCGPLDYACMCTYQADVLQCYDQCPKDIHRSTEESKLTAYCVAASATAIVSTPSSTFSVDKTSGAPTPTSGDAEPTETSTTTDGDDEPSNTESADGNATTTPADSAAAKITWMCASSLLAVLTAAFMSL